MEEIIYAILCVCGWVSVYVVLNVGKMPDLTVCADDTNQYNYSIVGIGDLVLLGERMHDE